MERGKAKAQVVAAGSNTTIKSAPGTLYQLFAITSNPNWTAWAENAADLGTSPDFNTDPSSATIAKFTQWADNGIATINFDPGIGFDALTVAATSNVRLLVVYE